MNSNSKSIQPNSPLKKPRKTMAIDLFSETTSPRISFSYDLHNHPDDQIPSILESRPDPSTISDSTPEFNFCFCNNNSIQTEPCSADELFSGGLIRPQQIPQRFSKKPVSLSNPKRIPSLPPHPVPNSAISDQKPKPNKPFWGIKRSNSLHCDDGYKKSPFWSFPLLMRSNSTGSVPKNKQQKSFSSSSSSSSSSLNAFAQKPPMRKNYGGGGGAYGNGVRISPVLNVVAPPCISGGSTNLFGFGSLFRNGKGKKKNKK